MVTPPFVAPDKRTTLPEIETADVQVYVPSGMMTVPPEATLLMAVCTSAAEPVLAVHEATPTEHVPLTPPPEELAPEELAPAALALEALVAEALAPEELVLEVLALEELPAEEPAPDALALAVPLVGPPPPQAQTIKASNKVTIELRMGFLLSRKYLNGLVTIRRAQLLSLLQVLPRHLQTRYDKAPCVWGSDSSRGEPLIAVLPHRLVLVLRLSAALLLWVLRPWPNHGIKPQQRPERCASESSPDEGRRPGIRGRGLIGCSSRIPLRCIRLHFYIQYSSIGTTYPPDSQARRTQ